MPREDGMATRGKWWVIHEDDMRRMLERVAAGEKVDEVLMEEYANSEVGEGRWT